MNWPNRLSLIRIACVPVITLLMVLDSMMWTHYAALFLFIAASITDFVDGWMARKYNLVTNFGKFIDPVADKLLVLCTMIMLSWHGLLPAWIVVAVVFRELAVDGLRLTFFNFFDFRVNFLQNKRKLHIFVEVKRRNICTMRLKT